MNQPWVYMCSPSWTPLSPPSTSHPSGWSQPWAPCLMHRTWTGDLFHMIYTWFNAIFSNHPTLAFSQSPKVCSLHLCLFCCLAYRVIVTVFLNSIQFSSVKPLSRVRLFATPWIAAHQASLSITNSQSSPKPMSIESVIPSNHLISSSVVPFSSCPQSFPASGSFPMSSSSQQVAKVLEIQLQHKSFQWVFRTDFF